MAEGYHMFSDIHWTGTVRRHSNTANQILLPLHCYWKPEVTVFLFFLSTITSVMDSLADSQFYHFSSAPEGSLARVSYCLCRICRIHLTSGGTLWSKENTYEYVRQFSKGVKYKKNGVVICRSILRSHDLWQKSRRKLSGPLIETRTSFADVVKIINPFSLCIIYFQT